VFLLLQERSETPASTSQVLYERSSSLMEEALQLCDDDDDDDDLGADVGGFGPGEDKMALQALDGALAHVKNPNLRIRC